MAADEERAAVNGVEEVRGAVAFEDAMGHQPGCGAFGFHLFGRLAKGECLRLGEHIGQEHVMETL